MAKTSENSARMDRITPGMSGGGALRSLDSLRKRSVNKGNQGEGYVHKNMLFQEMKSSPRSQPPRTGPKAAPRPNMALQMELPSCSRLFGKDGGDQRERGRYDNCPAQALKSPDDYERLNVIRDPGQKGEGGK